MIFEYFKDKSVLYAEDDSGIAKKIEEVLTLIFENVFYAEDGKKALELYYEKKPDIVIVDICMPILDGLGVIKEIRKEDFEIPAMVITAHDEKELLKRAVELNIFRYISKPFSRDSFLESLNSLGEFMIKRSGGLVVKFSDKNSYNTIEKKFITKDDSILLSEKESQLFEYFLKNKNKALTYDELIYAVYGYEEGNKESLKALIKELRGKIFPLEIKNIFSYGYKFEGSI